MKKSKRIWFHIHETLSAYKIVIISKITLIWKTSTLVRSPSFRPLLVKQLFGRCPFRSIFLQAGLNYAPELWWKRTVIEVNRLVQYLGQLFWFRNFKWPFSQNHLVQHNSQSPDIYTLIVGVSDEDLRTEVQGSPAEGGPELTASINAPTKITNFNDSLMKHHIFGLEIPMDNWLNMKLGDSWAELIKDRWGLFLCQPMLAKNIRDSLVQGTLHDDVEIQMVIKIAIDFDDVGVVEETLSLDLSGELLDHVFFLEFLLG